MRLGKMNEHVILIASLLQRAQLHFLAAHRAISPHSEARGAAAAFVILFLQNGQRRGRYIMHEGVERLLTTPR